MQQIKEFLKEYFALLTAILVVVIAAGISLAGELLVAQYLISTFTIAFALWKSVGMVRTLVKGRVGVDLLAVTAIFATVIVGEYWASMIIVLMFTVGEELEDFAERRAKRELTALLERNPHIAHREVNSSTGGVSATEEIPINDVCVSDVIVVKPGEVVPTDGKLLSPEATLDESSLTGESIPVERSLGQDIYSGAVNGSAAFRMTVTARAEDSQYQRIVALVSEATESKAPFVRMADRYAVPFTALAYTIAGTAWALTGEASRFAEVLVVATPCPLIIAAPVAFIAGMSRAAKNGIIVKSGGILEKLARISTVAFDKTGTLTVGKPVLSRIIPAPGFSAGQILRWAAIAEQYSSHTIAQSIVAGARKDTLDIPACHDVTETTAAGLSATIDGSSVRVGKFSFISEVAPGALKADIEPGELAVYIAVNNTFAGALLLHDEIRPETLSTLQELQRMGVAHSLMLTGDGRKTAEHVAESLGLTDIQAECLPEDKVTAVREIKNRPVMMVGDGVNDAPVLAVADVGVAMGARGSTAASESADVVIMKEDFHRVALAVSIGQRTIRIALQSIWLGITLSIVLMFIAAFGFLPAVVGAGLQELIDLLTILNALRALRTPVAR